MLLLFFIALDKKQQQTDLKALKSLKCLRERSNISIPAGTTCLPECHSGTKIFTGMLFPRVPADYTPGNSCRDVIKLQVKIFLKNHSLDTS